MEFRQDPRDKPRHLIWGAVSSRGGDHCNLSCMLIKSLPSDLMAGAIATRSGRTATQKVG